MVSWADLAPWPDEVDELDIKEQIKNKAGAELFKELKRHCSTAHPEDYSRNGAWLDDLMRLDIEILDAHRAEAGAPGLPPLSEIPEPKLPEAKPWTLPNQAFPMARQFAGMAAVPVVHTGVIPAFRPAGTPQLIRPGTSPAAGAAQPAAALAAALMARAAAQQGASGAGAAGATPGGELPVTSKAAALAGELPATSKAAALAAVAGGTDPAVTGGVKRPAEEQGAGAAKQPKAGFSKAASAASPA